MAIYPKIETRRAKRRNDAAYQHRRLRSLTGGHSIIIHRRHMEHQRSRGMFLRFGVAGQPLSHGPIVLRSPVRERSSAHGGRVVWATGCDAHAGTRRVPTVVSTSSHAFFLPNLAFPTPNLDRRGFSRASSTTSWEMQLSPVSF